MILNYIDPLDGELYQQDIPALAHRMQVSWRVALRWYVRACPIAWVTA